ncbi:unnamed protein product [Amoebophrya sp. A25]|nr:unnamed protein product [Amoebophrya sp. A25]|eukprot:GSA25T00017501001.1
MICEKDGDEESVSECCTSTSTRSSYKVRVKDKRNISFRLRWHD